MKPLRDLLASDDAVIRKAATLVSVLGPLPDSRLRMRRVRLALDRSPKPRSLVLLRPMVVLGVLFGGIASAGATWGVVQWVGADERPPVSVPPLPSPAQLPAVSRVSPRDERAATSEASVPEVEAAPEPVPASAPVLQAAKGVSSKRRAPSEPSLPVPSEADPGSVAAKKMSDSILVHQAVKALRSGGDAAQAAELLERYRSRNPEGVLAEEALALSIEAAVQKQDPRAKALAQKYLTRYPNGRFVDAARRAAR